jgi:hypothetical protein
MSNKSADKKKEYYKKWISDPVNHERQVNKLREKITCECSKVYSYVNRNSHYRTKYHTNYMAKKCVPDVEITADILHNKFADLCKNLKPEDMTDEHRNIIKLIQNIDKLEDELNGALMRVVFPKPSNKETIKKINDEMAKGAHYTATLSSDDDADNELECKDEPKIKLV